MTWDELADADPAVYRVVLELPDQRWWVAFVQANSFAEAKATARQSARLPDAPYLFGGRTGERFPARVLEAAIMVPRGWKERQG